MKLIQKIYTLPLLVMAVLMTGCEPIYTGAQPNTTLAQLKEKYSAATAETPVVITDDYIAKAYITGNDESGNIYKQIIVQDATAALPIQLDQGNVYTTYRRGQEVFINLKGMCVSVYGRTVIFIVCRLPTSRNWCRKTDGRPQIMRNPKSSRI